MREGRVSRPSRFRAGCLGPGDANDLAERRAQKRLLKVRGRLGEHRLPVARRLAALGRGICRGAVAGVSLGSVAFVGRAAVRSLVAGLGSLVRRLLALRGLAFLGRSGVLLGRSLLGLGGLALLSFGFLAARVQLVSVIGDALAERVQLVVVVPYSSMKASSPISSRSAKQANAGFLGSPSSSSESPSSASSSSPRRASAAASRALAALRSAFFAARAAAFSARRSARSAFLAKPLLAASSAVVQRRYPPGRVFGRPARTP